MSNLALEMVRHAGKYIACDSHGRIVADEWSEDKARMRAISLGITCPIVIYCPQLKPDLRNELAMTRVAFNAIQKLKKMAGVEKIYSKSDVEIVEEKLQRLLADFGKNSRDKETIRLLEELSSE